MNDNDIIKKTGLNCDIGITDTLANVLNIKNDDRVTSRIYITKQICEYIRKNKLQDEDDKRTIILDSNLKLLFGQNLTKIKYYELQKYLKNHIIKL